ncbi:Flp pilus assembly ATPase [Pandoraea nosoerga]|uniref:Flp pilus assembly ATPase n=2 Tax=Pandoraea nosoerga TaxID=2508296 RepID=A0A5E4Y4H3_9BURK|nr:Flp pilus assembly ATPase [Pandoraea nosoerga]
MNAPTRILDTMTELHRFLFCSAHAGHGQWLSAALREAGVVLQEAGRPAQLQQRIGDLDPQVVLLDFSGETGETGEPAGHAGEPPDGGIAQAVELAQMLKRVAPKLPLVAVGSMAHAHGMKAALRAGVHDFIDMHSTYEEALDVVRRVIDHTPEPTSASPQRHGRFVVLLGARIGVGCSTLAAHLSQLGQELCVGAAPERAARAKALKAMTAATVATNAGAVKAGAPDGKGDAFDASLVGHVALLDLGLPSGDGLLYLNTQSQFSFAEAVQNLRRFDETLVHTAVSHAPSGLAVLPLPLDLGEMRTVAAADALALTDRLRAFFDLIVADLGGFSNPAFVASLVRAADEVWLVVDQSVGAIVSLASLLRDLEERGVERHHFHLVLNRYDPRYGMAADQIAKRFDVPLLATLPDRPLAMLSATNQGKLILDTARSDPYVRALQPLVERLLAAQHAGAAVHRQSSGWLGRFMGKH